MLYQQGRTVEAEYAFKHVLTLDSHSTDAFFNLGVIAETKGDLQGALGYYQRATALNPSDQELSDAVRAVQTKISSQIASANRAKQQQQQAQQLAQDEGKRQQLKQIATDAQTAYKSGNFDKAISNLKMVAAQAPDDPDVQFALAQAYKGKGDLSNARNSLSRALSMDPNNTLYQTAMNDLNNRSAGNRNQNRNYQGYNGAAAPMPGSSNSIASGDSFSGADDQSTMRSPSAIPYQPTDTFASASPGQSANNYAANTSAPSGQLTPFTSQGESGLPGGGMRRGGVIGNGFYSRSGGYSTKTRLTRVAIGSAAGLAAGAMFGMGSHHMGRSMMGGALVGGAFGLLGGW
jgi:Flp pilus assembly protein TadD